MRNSILTVTALAAAMSTLSASPSSAASTPPAHAKKPVAAAAAAKKPIAAATPPAPAGDPVTGKSRFKAICENCHFSLKDANRNDQLTKIGPNLYGVVGRKAGTAPWFSYSRAMKGSGVTWSRDVLRPYIMNPQKMIPSVRMNFNGVPNPKDADDIVAYLSTQK